MTLRQFDPKNFEMILAGYPLEGYDLDFFSIQTDFDRYSEHPGIFDGVPWISIEVAADRLAESRCIDQN